jgi:hypothetical protein
MSKAKPKGKAESHMAVSLLEILADRFQANMNRHRGIKWSEVATRLDSMPHKLAVLQAMEATGGEPDVIGRDRKSGEFLFADCSAETPMGRRSVCYDREGLESRKEHRPANSAVDMAAEIGIELMSEEDYRQLQKIGPFDTKTSSWLKTPDDIRKLGGALFGDYRYGQVFIYHNGAQSYYGVRGFRGLLRV